MGKLSGIINLRNMLVKLLTIKNNNDQGLNKLDQINFKKNRYFGSRIFEIMIKAFLFRELNESSSVCFGKFPGVFGR